MDGMDHSAMDHSTHDHSAHAAADGMAMEHDHGAVHRREDGSYYYTHGAFLGHIVPGIFFTLWGLYWLLATFSSYLKSKQQPQSRGFKSKAWHKVFFGSAKVQSMPIEPLVKIILPFCGILGELWLGHGPQYQPLYAPDGKFNVDSLNDWQHSSMYFSFICSGFVDLLGHKTGTLPAGIEHVFLGLAFLSEGLLLAFHLKGPDIEYQLHFILVLMIFATVVMIIAEASCPTSIIAASGRPVITIVQGIWWIQTGYFMYKSIPAWDPDYMGSAMMAPVVLVMDLLLVSVASLVVLTVMRSVYGVSSSQVAFMPLKDSPYDAHVDEEHGAVLELSSYNGGNSTKYRSNNF